MNSNIKTAAVALISIMMGAVGSYFVFKGGESTAPRKVLPKKPITVASTTVTPAGKRVSRVTVQENASGRLVMINNETIPRPVAASKDSSAGKTPDDADEEDLTEKQKMVLKELQDALDDNDIRRVRKALSKFIARADKGGLAGDVPVCMRAKAVEALSWFGKEAAVDLIGFVADANEDVANDAFSAFEQALTDCEMGDRVRAQLVTSMMKAINDAEQVDSLLSQLGDMRNSVKVQAAKDILTTGTDNAKTVLTGQLESIFDDGVKDLDSLEKWQAMNPDDPDDNELYGGAK